MSKLKKERGTLQGHCACPIEGCNSSDAGALYLHKDLSHSYHCFSCGGSIPEIDPTNLTVAQGSPKGRVLDMEEEKLKMADLKETLCAMSNRERHVKAEVYEMYGCLMDMNPEGDKIDVIYYPTYRDNETGTGGTHVGYRNRKRFKSYHEEVKKHPEKLDMLKCFYGGIGDTKSGIQMFGQWLFEPNGKRIIINCGEEDAIATYVMTSMKTKFDGGYPSISVPSGESIAGVKPNLRYISSFEEIYVIADQDKAGRAFEEALCKLLPVGKVRLVRLPKGFKDPSQMLSEAMTSKARDRAAKVLWNALWSAEKYSPAGVMSLSEGWGKYLNRGTETKIRFPDSFGELNERTHGGYCLAEIVNIIAASSVGKSSFVKEMIEEALNTTPYNIGVISLEETIDEYIEGQLSIRMSQQLNEISDDMRNRIEEEKAFKEMCRHLPNEFKEVNVEAPERIHFLDHQGSCTGEELLEKIDFLIDGLDCKIIIVDPVTLAFSGRDTDQDEMASEIVKKVKRKKVAWINVHHVRKNPNGGKSNSEGADLSEEDIKGTGSWFQTGMVNLIFTRNKVHDNPIIKNTTKIKMSKCRRHGKNTGISGFTYYNGETGRLELGVDPETLVGNDEDFEGGFTDD